MARALTLRGIVVGDDGQPVAGASVQATWMAIDQQFGQGNMVPKRRQLTTDAQGAFEMEGLNPAEEVRLRARHQGAMTPKAEVVRAGNTTPLTLRIRREAGLNLAGRVTEVSGQPIPGARIEVRTRPWAPPPHVGEAQDLALSGGPIITNEEGKYITPSDLEPDGEYQVVASAKGYETERSVWLPVGNERPLTVPPLVLGRVQTLTGRILDRQGRPVVGALLTYSNDRKQETSQTNAEGHFRLSNVSDAAALLLVERKGYRTDGRLLTRGVRDLEITLLADSESFELKKPTSPPPIQAKERKAWVMGLVVPALAKAPDNERMRLYESLALVDSGQVLQGIEENRGGGRWSQDYLRRAVVQRLKAESLAEARSVAEAMRDASFRTQAFLDLYEGLPPEKIETKRELLAQALLHGRAIPDGSHRAIHLGWVARRFHELGDPERVATVLREALPVARQLATSGWAAYARGAFAEEYAILDLEGALELIKDLKDIFEYDRHHGNIAHRLGGRKPAEAERILALVGSKKPASGQPQYAVPPADVYAPRVCFRMAPVDRTRARAVAGRVRDPLQRAQALGAIAEALGKSDPRVAAELLQEAFAVLKAHVEEGKDTFNGMTSAPVMALHLVSVAETLNPSLEREYFWRALALRRIRPKNEMHGTFHFGEPAALALMAIRHDRDVAAWLLEPVDRQAVDVLKDGQVRALLPALALGNPRRALQVFETIPAGPLRESHRASLAKYLALEGEARWKEARHVLGLWTPDEEDL